MNPIARFCSVGVVILFVAFILQLITAISLPSLTNLNIVRVDFSGAQDPSVSQVGGSVKALRLGIWAYCADSSSTGDRTCVDTGHGYAVGVEGPTNSQVVNIRSSWTRGLAVHPVATAVTFVAFALAFSNHITVLLIASLVSFLAALLTLIAFAIDIAFFVLTKNAMGDLGNVTTHTNPGPGFWLTLVSFILLLLSGCTVCFSRHRARKAKGFNTTTINEKRPFWRRFRRGNAV